MEPKTVCVDLVSSNIPARLDFFFLINGNALFFEHIKKWLLCIFSPQKLWPLPSSVWGEQGVHSSSERHQAGACVCQAFRGLAGWSQRWGQLYGQARKEPLHPAVRLLWWRGMQRCISFYLNHSCKLTGLSFWIWSSGEGVESVQTRVRSDASGTWRFCAGNGCALLWDLFLYGNWSSFWRLFRIVWLHISWHLTWFIFLQQVGDDKTIKQWKMESPGYGEEEEPINTILGKVCCNNFAVSSHRIAYSCISEVWMKKNVPCRLCTQVWIIIRTILYLQRAASRWTSGMSRGAARSALSPGV